MRLNEAIARYTNRYEREYVENRCRVWNLIDLAEMREQSRRILHMSTVELNLWMDNNGIGAEGAAQMERILQESVVDRDALVQILMSSPNPINYN